MGQLNLDTVKSEATNKPHVLVKGGQRFKLPSKLPLRAVLAASRGDIEALLKALFKERWEEFLDTDPTSDEVEKIVSDLYGANGLGESQASDAS